MNKGFTLVELMAVLVLIVIIATIGYAGITVVNNNIEKNLWNTTVEEIETGAVQYGQDNLSRLTSTCNNGAISNCLEVTVGFLIERNYVDTDEVDDSEKEIITNNVTGEIVNDNIVCIYLENNRVYAQYQE